MHQQPLKNRHDSAPQRHLAGVANQDVLLGVYDSEKECQEAAVEQGVKGECLPLKGVLAEHPAGFTAQM